MFNQTFWRDHVTQYRDRYRETENPDGTFTHTRVEGEVIQEGTPHNQNNMNALGFGIQDAHIAAAISLFFDLQSQRVEETNPDLYDSLCAGKVLAFGLLQEQRANGNALEAVGAELERVAETSSLTERDESLAAAMLAFGNLQQQMLNDERFSLIASEALGESHTVTLTNNQKFPFNSTVDSPVTVALTTRRKNLFYSVEPEVTANVGPVGEIRVTDKQLNGFKVSFDGCGKSVSVILRMNIRNPCDKFHQNEREKRKREREDKKVRR